jgi:hypothetical protein
VPVLEAARRLPDHYARSVWIEDNLDYCRRSSKRRAVRDRAPIGPLLDPQTSGGLLVAAPADRVAPLLDAGFHRIGEVTDAPALEIIG